MSELSGFTCTKFQYPASCGIENFEFIVSERVQVNPDNSRAMSALTFLLFKLNTLQTKIVKLSHGVMTVVYWIGPLHDLVTWYKIKYTGEQVAQWDFENNAPAFVLEVPLWNLLTSICNFVPCDRVVQRAYLHHGYYTTIMMSRRLFCHNPVSHGTN